MQIIVNNPQQQTLIFGVIFLVVLIAFLRFRKKDSDLFPPTTTNELKGVAIIAIVLAHIGYFLSTNTQFLFPFSIFAGAGVDLFLFLSGFGLASSALKKEITALEFYKKRLKKILVPMWLVMVLLLIADWLILGIKYPSNAIIKNFFGFFQKADLFNDINSPLWFITLIFAYYLLFPLVFNKRAPWISALILFFLGYYFVQAPHEKLQNVLHLWKWHILAFPVGVAWADALNAKWLVDKIAKLKKCFSRFDKVSFVVRLFLASALLTASWYVAVDLSIGSGWWYEEKICVLVALLTTLAFVILPIRFALLEIIGSFSYEIYLIHWPLLYRYDLFYKYLPAGTATAVYFVFFIGLSFLLQKGAELTAKKITFGRS